MDINNWYLKQVIPQVDIHNIYQQSLKHNTQAIAARIAHRLADGIYEPESVEMQFVIDSLSDCTSYGLLVVEDLLKLRLGK